jgi:chitin synthase
LICPRQNVFSYAELEAFDGKGHNQAYIAMRGIVYDLGSFAPRHYPPIVPTQSVLKYAGKDATNLFPVQVSALCTGTSGSVDPAVQLDYKNTNYSSMDVLVSSADLAARFHDFRWFTNDSRPDWWWEQQYTLKNNYMKGHIGYTPAYVATLANKLNYFAFM